MTLYNSGEIDFNMPLNDVAIAAIQEFYAYADDYGFDVGDMTWYIEDEPGNNFEDDVHDMIDILAPLDYVLNGEVQYYGDYNGKIYIENNKITLRNIEDTGLYEADDLTLIEMLEERGYTVTKNAAS